MVVYPRACGGTMTYTVVTLTQIGLSPRLRGNPDHPVARAICPRSIPALAGEPRLHLCVVKPITVYPRACGGTSVGISKSIREMGLSPRLRGNRQEHSATGAGHRSIPALAGEPNHGVRGGAGRAVYPRACGGTWGKMQVVARYAGLSPRLRGNLKKGLNMVAEDGSIPALAGEPILAAAQDMA